MPETAWDAVTAAYECVRKRYPDATRPTTPSLVQLLDRPAKRLLKYNEDQVCKMRFSLPSTISAANRNVRAALLQVSGTAREQMCVRCSENRNLWDICVGDEQCASCIYNGQGKPCCVPGAMSDSKPKSATAPPPASAPPERSQSVPVPCHTEPSTLVVEMSTDPNTTDRQGSQDPAAATPAPFEISECTDGTMGWKLKSGQRCVRLYYGPDMKSVLTKSDAIEIRINAAEISNFVRKDTTEGSSSIGIVKVIYKDAARSPVTLVFDRSKGSSIDLGKKQARRFIAWLRRCDVRPCVDDIIPD